MTAKPPTGRGPGAQPASPVRIWQLADLCETVQGPVSEPVAKFLHEGLMIGLVEAGEVEASYRGAFHRLERGALIVVQPEQTIGFDLIASDEASLPARICVHCPTEVVQRAMDEVAGRRSAMHLFQEAVRWDPYLATLVREFQESLARPASLLERSSRFHELLTGVIRAYSPRSVRWEPKPEPVLVRQVRDYLHDHHAEGITLDELARMVNLSAFHLNRVFRKHVGLPPHAYQTRARVLRGKALLSQGMPIARAAAEAGFFDQSHFTYHFKRLLSFTPAAYQKRVLSAEFL
jgi:AraC-like DNA-binding protein